MRAILDHVGIAIADLPAAIAFYRDSLGLEIESAEEVASQRVRVHFLRAAANVEPGRSLELLESTSADSPIAKFIDKRGPGLHHITLRVDDITGALTELKARGVRLVDETPRPGAEGSLVAFIHPSSANGVLVELKQAAPQAAMSADPTVRANPTASPRAVTSTRYALGNLELISLHDGYFRLDGGAMFGVVPKTLWGKKAAPDGHNRILLAMRPLIVRGARTMLIDAGVGDKEGAKFAEIYALERQRNLDHTLAEAQIAVEDIDIVLATHLHFDHAGGFTVRGADGRVRPRFPRAQYVVRRGEWEDATHPNERNRASYLADNYVPLAEAGVLQLVDEDQTIMPGVRVRRTGGHTPHHQMVIIESMGKSAAFVADMMPTTAHLSAPWVMGYDLLPLDTLEAKKRFVPEAIERQMLVFFEHDPSVAAGYIREADGKQRVEAASS